MRISQVGAIALVILAASLACAGADEPLIPDSQKVRLNLYVADMAEVASDDDINLTLNEMIATGSTTIRAIANFDFDLHFEWAPVEEWQDYPAMLSPVSATEFSGLGEHLVPLSLKVDTNSTGGGGEWGSSPSEGVVATETVGVTFENEDCGQVMITLSHAL